MVNGMRDSGLGKAVMALGLIGVAGNISFAAPAPVAAALGEAEAWLREIAGPLQASPFVDLRFQVEVMSVDAESPQRYAGRLQVADSNRFRLEVPMGTWVSDGRTFWEYHASTAQVVVKSADALAGKALPARVLLDYLASPPLRCDTLAPLGAGGGSKKRRVRLLLQPGEHAGQIDSLEVHVDLKSRKWESLVTLDAQGTRTRYDLNQLKTRKTPPTDAFRFVPPAKTEIVDMR